MEGKAMKRALVLLSVFLLVSCGEDDGGNPGSGGGSGGNDGISTLRVQITSDEVSAFSTILFPAVACNVNVGMMNYNGDCTTPLAMKAKIARINLANSFGDI